MFLQDCRCDFGSFEQLLDASLDSVHSYAFDFLHDDVQQAGLLIVLERSLAHSSLNYDQIG